MKKHWKIILVTAAFVLLFAIQIRDVIVINNMEDWLSAYYESQNSLSQYSPPANRATDLDARVSQLEVTVSHLDSAMQKVWTRLGFY